MLRKFVPIPRTTSTKNIMRTLGCLMTSVVTLHTINKAVKLEEHHYAVENSKPSMDLDPLFYFDKVTPDVIKQQGPTNDLNLNDHEFNQLNHRSNKF